MAPRKVSKTKAPGKAPATTAKPVGQRGPRKPRRLIFISYRRADSAEISGRLYDWLSHTFGRDCVIKDVYSIPPGVDFRVFIERMIPSCTSLIAIIGPQWRLDQPDKRRAAPKEDDLVRLELQCALAHGIPIVPVLVGGVDVPPPKRLPKELRGIVRRQAIPLRSDPDFHRDVDRLIAHL